MTQVFDEEETPELDPETFGSIGPDSRLKTIAAFRLLAFDYPVNDFFQSFATRKSSWSRSRGRRGWPSIAATMECIA